MGVCQCANRDNFYPGRSKQQLRSLMLQSYLQGVLSNPPQEQDSNRPSSESDFSLSLGNLEIGDSIQIENVTFIFTFLDYQKPQKSKLRCTYCQQSVLIQNMKTHLLSRQHQGSQKLLNQQMDPLLLLHQTMTRKFTSQGVSFVRQILLRRIAQDSPFQEPGAEDLVPRLADSLLLNSIELAYWELLLNSTSPAQRQVSFHLYIFTAFLAKASLNQNTDIFQAVLEKEYISQFRLEYQNWLLVTNCPMSVNLVDLNQRFNLMLSDHHKYRNYEQMIDQLMEQPKVQTQYLQEAPVESIFNDLTEIEDFSPLGFD